MISSSQSSKEWKVLERFVKSLGSDTRQERVLANDDVHFWELLAITVEVVQSNTLRTNGFYPLESRLDEQITLLTEQDPKTGLLRRLRSPRGLALLWAILAHQSESKLLGYQGRGWFSLGYLSHLKVNNEHFQVATQDIDYQRKKRKFLGYFCITNLFMTKLP